MIQVLNIGRDSKGLRELSIFAPPFGMLAVHLREGVLEAATAQASQEILSYVHGNPSMALQICKRIEDAVEAKTGFQLRWRWELTTQYQPCPNCCC